MRSGGTGAMRVFGIAVGVFVLLGASLSADDNWPQFRGPGSRGTSDERDLPEAWSKTENVAWATKIAGRGWSSPIVWGDKIFLTSAIQLKGDVEKVKPGLYFGGERKTPKVPFRYVVDCLDFNTGKILWEKTAFEGIPKFGHHLKNTMASETPVTDGERVYAYFGNVGVFAYDLDGNEKWSRELGAYPMANNWGTAASPVLFDGRLYVQDDNEKHSFLSALDAKTGKELWRKDRDEKSNWATPYVWKNEKRTELVTCGVKSVRSYDLDGKLLWQLSGMSSIVIPTPFSADGLLYVTSGYVLSPKKPLFAIKAGASGDISLDADKKQTSNAHIAWANLTSGPYNVSPVLYKDVLYVLYDRGTLSSFNAHTGEALYDPPQARIGTSGHYTASPWAYNDKVFCLSEEGLTLVVEAGGTKPKIVRKNDLEELCMATPAIARGSLFIRTESQLYRIASKNRVAVAP
ncbi:MAG TPA: PQQ-binding-like beta-propeller repeat protein [Planctomycetaceae bacterium]|jgi:outer membrane protein assembly factor BamB|nr:PQQ-binding-like beta-propeller repeat protein [Planctomycetaceae bacterium]